MTGLDAERQKQAAELAAARRRLSRAEFGLTAALAAALILTPLAGNIAGFLPAGPVGAALFAAFLLAVYFVLFLPLDYYGGLVLPRRYELSRQDFRGWLSDRFKSVAMGLVFGAAAAGAVFGLIGLTADWWWLFAWLGLLAVSLVLTVLAPVLIIPLFFPMKPMPGGELKERLSALADRAGVRVGGIHLIEFSGRTTQANAVVMGLGRTKRIAISDTMIDRYSPGEVEVVMAHELAHQRYHDVWRLYGFQAVVLSVVFATGAWLFDAAAAALDYAPAEPAALPLLLACFFAAGLPALPALAWFSRRLEKSADAYALELTGDPEAFITAMTRLTDQNLAEARPSSWLERLGQDHPSYDDRVKMAAEYTGKAGN
jgi:STE24 endopeptidase